MLVRKTLIAFAAAGLALGSTAAAAAPVPAEQARVSSPVDEAEGMRGWGWLLLLVAGLAVLGLKVLGDDPTSP
jgi:hypothetical protein